MKVFLHLGPPKTGTTYLQECCFPYATLPNVYVGKRLGGNQRLYEIVRDATEQPSFGGERERNAVREEIRQLGDQGISRAIYSNEMSLVDNGAITWQRKLGRISQLVDGFDVEVILGVREPSSALYSLFVELYSTLPRRFRDPRDFVREYNGAQVFHYDDLLNRIDREFNSPRISFIDFESLSRLSVDRGVLQRLEISAVDRGRLNEKERSTSGDYVTNRPTLRSMAAAMPGRQALKRAIPNRMWNWGGASAGRVKLRKPMAIPPFDEELVQWIARAHVADMRTLAARGFDSGSAGA